MDDATGIGAMSGTSLDGVDLALCNFYKKNGNWRFEIIKTKTIKYNEDWKNALANAYSLETFEFLKLHKDYGIYIGELINKFRIGIGEKIDFIASHGHTIFHQPEEGITFQIGDGACISELTKIKTVSDFRNQDVVLGGKGAPLVPIGDEYLFSEYDYCLNLGGFSNISFKNSNKRIAYDICPVNTIINYLAHKLKFDFDNKGQLALKGQINKSLLNELNELKYYQQKAPKSLGREWLWNTFIPIVDFLNIKIEDKLRTIYEHISIQIASSFNNKPGSRVLITGGGAYNDFLVELIKNKTNTSLVIPSSNIIEFKEALIFAFLGLLRIRNEVNCLSSVTGANRDHSSGVIYDL